MENPSGMTKPTSALAYSNEKQESTDEAVKLRAILFFLLFKYRTARLNENKLIHVNHGANLWNHGANLCWNVPDDPISFPSLHRNTIKMISKVNMI